MQFHEKKLDLFDFTNFFCLDFFKFSGPLCTICNIFFQRSNKGVDDLLSHGQTILETLRDQRGMMKGIRKKMLDVASMLGMSNTVMRLIERRSEGDKYILFGGMIVTCIIMYIVVKYFT